MMFHTVAVCPDEDPPSNMVILPQEGAAVKREVKQNRQPHQAYQQHTSEERL